MYREENISIRIRLAIIMLIALLMLSMQQHVLRNYFSKTIATTVEIEKQLTIKQSQESNANFGIVQNDLQLTFALLLAFAFLLHFFPAFKSRRAISFAPLPLSRNFSCIVPKGP